MTDKNLVWYASFGSNINADRFLCYIQGGKPELSNDTERGCRDATLPRNEKPFIMNHPVFFAKEAARWNGGGVAFIDPDRYSEQKTYSNMYLVTREQFQDIVAQENKLDTFDMDFEEVMEKGSKKVQDSWYGNILYLGDEDGHPVFTFTTPVHISPEEVKKPSVEYLSTIIGGLKKGVGLNEDQIVEYFMEVPGVKGEFTEKELRAVIERV
ncbi:hypothetical protein LCL89_09710 [Halobacillus yeomjeoni]|uniref:hypothetical protein n=1 Tax=Halobacillus yeomjeoni TaxID=311194 RepID=UPI001CD6E4A8|nr:hypothetical protein [Halobacillus yeomjeoni]MCA0984321.1 hypothetical protein [Halobacillus yeomjeoni]